MQRITLFFGILAMVALSLAATNADEVFGETPAAVPISSIENKGAQQAFLKHQELQQRLRDSLKHYFDGAIANGTIVGVGVSVVKGDSILFAGGFGKRNVKTENRVNGETVFRLGSLSKGFGGVLATSLEKNGQLSLQDAIVDHVPNFQFGNDRHTRSVQLRHVLSHTSGTPYHSYTNLVEAGLSPSDIAPRFVEVDPISGPGEQYSYQNAMFAMGQELMERATGTSVKELLSQGFFEPLGMAQVSMDHKPLLQGKNVALPHRKRGRTWQQLPLTDKYYNAVLAGGINASALDMAKWMRFLLGHNPDVLGQEDLEKAFDPIIELNQNGKYYQRWPGHQKSAYALGWRVHHFQEENGLELERVLHHGGSVNSYRNEIALYPETNLGICVLFNSPTKLASTVIPEVHRLVKEVYADADAPAKDLASLNP
ncbi:serine hydrolase domain-containing protein [Maribacter sp. 2307ULW6-5]|uniref:serine hydrolase domain-containing protein n=1 Tax=Maribacter sp. 2307ULW6-5 TaxID=3386275 RepID=UPI0039BD82A5